MPLSVAIHVILKKLIQAYREIGREAGHASHELKVGAHSWGWIAEDGEQAVKIISIRLSKWWMRFPETVHTGRS